MLPEAAAKTMTYILVGGEPVPVREHARWQDWINTHERTLARTDLSDALYVETWFVGVDQRPTSQPGPPLLFSTEVWRDGKRAEHYRLSTLKRAGLAHTNVAARLMAEAAREAQRPTG